MLGFRKVGIPQLGVISNTTPPGPTLGDFGIWKVLDNPNPYGTSASDNYAFSVAMSNDYAIVGAWQEDEAGGTGSGKAYIYSTSTGSLLYTLTNPNAYSTVLNDNFGNAVAISDSYAIVSAYSEDDAGGSASGKAYIYSTSTGSLLYTLTNPNAYSTSASDQFGNSVAISESYAIVGAYAEDSAAGSASGAAYIYSTSTGSLLYTLTNPNSNTSDPGDQFGYSVAISGTHAIVSAIVEDDASGTQSGKAYIYSTSTGSLLYTLDNPNPYGTSDTDNFGRAVAISDSYAIVGAWIEDDAGGTQSGKAYIYSTSTGSLLYTLDNPNAYSTTVGDNFGNAVAISESFAIVGASAEDDAGGTQSGKAYIYSTTTGSLLYTLDNPTAYLTSQDDNFGYSVGISDSHAIVGTWQEDDAGGTSSGKAYLYTRIEDDHITVPANGLAYLTSVTGTATTITIPATAQVGDIAVLVDLSTTTTNTVPSGWTSINGATTTGIRTNISYRVLTSGQAGSTITGMAGVTRKVLLVFRDYGDSTPTVAISTVNTQATTAVPTNQTIFSDTGKNIFIAAYGSTGAIATRGFTQFGQTPTELSVVSTQRVYVKFTISDTGTNEVASDDAAITMSDGGTNTLQSFSMKIT